MTEYKVGQLIVALTAWNNDITPALVILVKEETTYLSCRDVGFRSSKILKQVIRDYGGKNIGVGFYKNEVRPANLKDIITFSYLHTDEYNADIKAFLERLAK